MKLWVACNNKTHRTRYSPPHIYIYTAVRNSTENHTLYRKFIQINILRKNKQLSMKSIENKCPHTQYTTSSSGIIAKYSIGILFLLYVLRIRRATAQSDIRIIICLWYLTWFDKHFVFDEIFSFIRKKINSMHH